MKHKITLFAILLVTASIAFGQKSKKEVNWSEIDALVGGKEFRIESTSARAQADASMNAIATAGLQPPGSAGNRFNLIGNFNFLEMKGDSVSAYLPYFGQKQMSGGHYTDDNAIEFEGIPNDLSIEKNEKKKRYDISFNIDNKTENYQVSIQLYPNLKSNMTINSNQRFVIKYDGEVGEVTEGKDNE